MQCPRCKTDDVYVSQRQNQTILSLVWVKLRCHRCCNLFSAPRWAVTSREQQSPDARKAA